MRLHHLHLPALTRYRHASYLQDLIVRRHLDYKLLRSSDSPPPTLLTFQTFPIYTCGRREIDDVSAAQISYLRSNGSAEFAQALRGGQTTFHGPGQLTAYLIISLDAHALIPRTYVRLLEDSVISTCASFGVKSFTTENPGVWTSDENKIASVGVHLRRSVSSHGVGLNVNTDLKWFERIVACGLPDKRTTSLAKEGAGSIEIEDAAVILANTMAKALSDVQGVEIVYEVSMTS